MALVRSPGWVRFQSQLLDGRLPKIGTAAPGSTNAPKLASRPSSASVVCVKPAKMVQLTWQFENEEDSTAIVPGLSFGARVDDILRTGNYVLSSWELAALTLPGCLFCVAFPRSAHLIVAFYRLLLGTLYPAYASYKAIRTKDVEEYVRWMMYWIVFALFTASETITDIFLSFWFPFYYEAKIVVVLWLLSPATEGSSILYRKFVHPVLVKREKEIDAYLDKAKKESYKTVVELGTRGVQYASRVIMQTAINGGGGLMNTLRKSYSLGDVSPNQEPIRRRVNALPPVDENDRPASRVQPSRDDSDTEEFDDLADDFNDVTIEEVIMEPPVQKATRTKATREIYFNEIDNVRPNERFVGEVRSVEDISSGYSSTEFLPSESAVAAGDTVQRRSTASRSKTSRPTSVVDSVTTRSTRSSASAANDASAYATLPRATKKRTTSTKTSTARS